MKERNQIKYNLIALAFLFLVSLYRQLSLRYMPEDGLRTYILYAGYIILLAVWARSIRNRITQKNMRIFLLAEDLIMFIGLTIRFVQDTFLTENIPALRSTGFLAAGTFLPLFTLGLLASAGIGQDDNYKLPRKWFLLLIPSAITIPVLLTDDLHHIITYIIPEEPQPNLIYHPNWGFMAVCAAVLVVVALRVLIIYRRNNIMDSRPVLRAIIPFTEAALQTVFYMPYIINWMKPDAPLAPTEIIEQYAKAYYIEVITWEIYIYLGLVPVNTGYREIFEKSTFGLQIRTPEGEVIRSENSISEAVPGKELHVFHPEKLPKGTEVLWAKDVSRIQETIDELNATAEELAQEGTLLKREIAARNQETRTAVQNGIYDTLNREIHDRIELVKEIAEHPGEGGDRTLNMKYLLVLGTYIKRRCNLRLTEMEKGSVNLEDLELSLRDMDHALKATGLMAGLPEVPLRDEVSPVRIFDETEDRIEEVIFAQRKGGEADGNI
ncbi:MAG: hypothetical protein K5637_00510 [Lachnospiraceae bacterium]|nr:hypothetical protein [Lachnospiraceae bacterium]